MDPTRRAELLAELAAIHGDTIVLARLMQQEWPGVLGARNSPRTTVFAAIFGRALAWMLSLQRLGEVYDFQAYGIASRFFFEAAVDLVLLNGDPTALDKYLAWDESAKLHAARTAADGGYAEPEERAWLQQHEEPIKESRRRHWGGNGHPPRWTGPKHSLRTDAATADAMRALDLAKVVRIIHALNWSTHGSGTLVARLDEETMAATARGFLRAVNWFAVIVTSIVLEGLGLTPPKTRDEIEDLMVRLRLDSQILAMKAVELRAQDKSPSEKE